jgi:hypothetical protein
VSLRHPDAVGSVSLRHPDAVGSVSFQEVGHAMTPAKAHRRAYGAAGAAGDGF